MKFTIITPTYNSATTLKQTMLSVAEQKLPPFEYIIMDGASKDETLEIAKKYGATHVISEPDKGIADAFNKGIKIAQGDWIGIINSDDWYAEKTLELVVQAIEQNPDADIIHGHVQYWQDNKPTEVFIPRQDKLIKEMTINHPSVFVKKAVYERLGTFDKSYKYAMDYELLLRFWQAGCKFVALDTVIANMRYGGASDRYWYKAYIESAKAKKAHIGNPINANLYCMWQIIRGGIRRFLEKIGLQGMISFFRKYFSIMRKE